MANIEREVLNEIDLPDDVIYDMSRFVRPDWRTCKRNEARIIEQHYREIHRNARLQINEVARFLELIAELGL